jgi:hypothetical protein
MQNSERFGPVGSILRVGTVMNAVALCDTCLRTLGSPVCVITPMLRTPIAFTYHRRHVILVTDKVSLDKTSFAIQVQG